ncbi:hypothetical protein [Duganella sp. LjRoot269]|uniref:hypothetical protein n=1 Tax=Duganella sp. LjRoot269 TaxID=3342305 RepID=UPI003ECEC1D5
MSKEQFTMPRKLAHELLGALFNGPDLNPSGYEALKQDFAARMRAPAADDLVVAQTDYNYDAGALASECEPQDSIMDLAKAKKHITYLRRSLTLAKRSAAAAGAKQPWTGELPAPPKEAGTINGLRYWDMYGLQEHARAALAQRAISVEAQPVAWEMIESAPKDGRTLLLGYFNKLGNWRTMRGRWYSAAAIADDWEDPDDAEEGWYETAVEPDIPNCWATTPTHWQPLPAKPAVGDDASPQAAAIDAAMAAQQREKGET